MLNEQNEVRNKNDFVFYNNLTDVSGILQHSGDNLTGGQGDCEQITVNMNKVPNEIAHITFVVTIFEALERQQTFGRVNEAYIRVVDGKTNNEIVRYNLEKEFYSATSVLIADIVKYNGEWYFDAVGAPFSGGLQAISNDFNLDLVKR
jgi:tellurium resistance protein TerD